MNEPWHEPGVDAFHTCSAGLPTSANFSRTKRMKLSVEFFERKAYEARDCDRDRLQHAAGSAGLSSHPRSP